MVAGPAGLSVAQREQISDARLLLESAAHNAAIVVRAKGPFDDTQLQALQNAAAQAAQAAGTLRRVERALRCGTSPNPDCPDR